MSGVLQSYYSLDNVLTREMGGVIIILSQGGKRAPAARLATTARRAANHPNTKNPYKEEKQE